MIVQIAVKLGLTGCAGDAMMKKTFGKSFFDSVAAFVLKV